MEHDYSVLWLENQMCFPLYACSREIIKRCRPQLDALGLTYTQYIVLLVIWKETTVSVRDLGRQLYLDSGTLTPVLKTLEKMGLITRARSKEDERVLMVTITEQGLALREQALSLPQATMDAMALNEKDAKQLYKLLYQVLGTMSQE